MVEPDGLTPIPGGNGSFIKAGLAALSGSNVAFAGMRGFPKQEGIYLFEGGVLSRVAVPRLAKPGPNPAVTDNASYVGYALRRPVSYWTSAAPPRTVDSLPCGTISMRVDASARAKA